MPRLVFAALIAAARAFVAPVAPAAAPTALRSTEVGVGPETGGALFDPAGFTKIASPTTMKWFRASELKHGRVAMLANVGWVVQASGYGTIKFPLEGGLAPLSKIIATAGMIELITESAVQPHYMAPGGNGYIDIFGYSKSGEDFTDLQNQELKNGRLAMIGIAGFVCSALVPGSVPGSPW
ncbi:chlorophyll A-B binding protein [Aureococcus anophagefferens]|nr:chlorophyll A-B binding protein [Aureococcus anophagefferens]